MSFQKLLRSCVGADSYDERRTTLIQQAFFAQQIATGRPEKLERRRSYRVSPRENDSPKLRIVEPAIHQPAGPPELPCEGMFSFNLSNEAEGPSMTNYAQDVPASATEILNDRSNNCYGKNARLVLRLWRDHIHDRQDGLQDHEDAVHEVHLLPALNDDLGGSSGMATT